MAKPQIGIVRIRQRIGNVAIVAIGRPLAIGIAGTCYVVLIPILIITNTNFLRAEINRAINIPPAGPAHDRIAGIAALATTIFAVCAGDADAGIEHRLTMLMKTIARLQAGFSEALAHGGVADLQRTLRVVGAGHPLTRTTVAIDAVVPDAQTVVTDIG